MVTTVRHGVAQRSHEIGVRMAAVGLGLGTIGALGLGGLLARYLHEVNSRDPVTLGLAACLLGAIAIGASALPACRATRVDPVAALHAK